MVAFHASEAGKVAKKVSHTKDTTAAGRGLCVRKSKSLEAELWRTSTSYVCSSVETESWFPAGCADIDLMEKLACRMIQRKIVALRPGRVAGTQRQLCERLTNGID